MLTEKIVGSVLLLASVVIFIYYTTWVLVLPFVSTPHVLYSFFPPPVYAIMLPAAALCLGVLGVAGFIGYILRKEAAAKKAK